MLAPPVAQENVFVTTSIQHYPPDASTEEQPDTPVSGGWAETAHSREFGELRRRFRSFVFPIAGLFLTLYLIYVVLLVYARDFMSQQVIGNVPVSMLLALLQFATTFGITIGYAVYANRRLDPVADEIRARLQRGDQ